MAKFSRNDLAQYIADNIDDTDSIANKVAGFLIDNNKTSELGSIMRDVTSLRASEKGVVELTATSAFALDSEAQLMIEKLTEEHFKNVKKIIIHEVIDKSVIGGVNIDFANANLDLTIRAKLNKLREAVA